jgi:peptide/nickel transport system substrate-binding protein
MMRPNIAKWTALALVACSLLAACTSLWGGERRETQVSNVNPQAQNTAQPSTREPAITPTDAFTPTPTEIFTPSGLSASNCSYGGQFKSIQALDRYTVRFTLCASDPAFLSKIAFPSFAIYPQEWLASIDTLDPTQPLLSNPPGSGPYQLSDWRRGEALAFQAFDGYWQAGKPAIPTLTFRWNLDSGERLVELQAGTVQGIDNLAGSDYPVVQSDPGLVLVPRLPLSVLYLGMNNTQSPFDDPRVRQAIAMGIDRSLLMEYLPAGFQVAEYFTPCAIPDACEGEAWYNFDPVQARQLLADAGYPGGFATELAYRDVVRGYLPQPGRLAQALRTQLRENLDIDLRLRAMEENEFLAQVDTGELPGLYLLGWGADYPHADNFLDTHFGSQATLQFGKPDEELAALILQARSQADPEARRLAYAAVNTLIRQKAPMVPLAHGGWIIADSLAVAYAANVQGGHASPMGLEDFSMLAMIGESTFTWMQEEEPRSLYCATAQDLASLRACSQLAESLYRYTAGGAAVEPGLADSCTPESDFQTWTCTLRQDVQFHDNTTLDANDVVASFAIQWDASNPLHPGDSAPFVYFKDMWGAFLNQPTP